MGKIKGHEAVTQDIKRCLTKNKLRTGQICPTLHRLAKYGREHNTTGQIQSYTRGFLNTATTVKTRQPGMQKFFTRGAGRFVLKCLENDYNCVIDVEYHADLKADQSPIVVEDCYGLESLKAEALHLPEFLAAHEESTVETKTSEPQVTAVELGVFDAAVWTDSCGIHVGRVTLEVCVGDITKEKIDAIVTVNDSHLNLHSGGVLNSTIAKLGGPVVSIECHLNLELHGTFEPGKVIMTSAGNLPSKHIFHVVLSAQSADKVQVQDCIEKCLHLADSKGLASIAMPVIGTGLLHMSTEISANIIYGAFHNFAQKSPRNLHFVKVVVYHNNPSVSPSCFQQCLLEKHAHDFTRDVYSHLTEQNESLPPVIIGAESSGMQHERFQRKEDLVSFHMFASNEGSLIRAEDGLNKALRVACTTQKVEHEVVCHLSAGRRKHLLMHEITHDVSLDIGDSCIIVSGGAEDVCHVVCKIWQEISETVKERQVSSNNELLSYYIQWVYIVSGEEVAFSKKVNSFLETASGSMSGGVQFLVGKHKYYVDFLAMRATCLDRRTPAVSLLRKVLGKDGGDPLPTYWFPQPASPNGVSLVTLNNMSTEFQEVHRQFFMSQRCEDFTILTISRVQNPFLYQGYAVRKRQMSSESGGNENEKFLFHGTNEWSVAAINAQGFNRSFAGTHGALYGNGVYFARDSSCSLSYTSPDSDGERHMYWVRVLVGQYTKGKSGMKQPPPVDHMHPQKLFDSVVDNVEDPKMHVVFHDSQSYPEYLITFITH